MFLATGNWQPAASSGKILKGKIYKTGEMPKIKLADSAVQTIKEVCSNFGNKEGELINVLHGIQEKLGYINFYYWILLTTIPGFIVTALVKIHPEYGKKNQG